MVQNNLFIYKYSNVYIIEMPCVARGIKKNLIQKNGENKNFEKNL